MGSGHCHPVPSGTPRTAPALKVPSLCTEPACLPACLPTGPTATGQNLGACARDLAFSVLLPFEPGVTAMLAGCSRPAQTQLLASVVR